MLDPKTQQNRNLIVGFLAFIVLILVISHRASTINHLTSFTQTAAPEEHASNLLTFPEGIKRLMINIGPNTTPILPPADDASSAVLAIEPNIGVSHYLRENFQKKPEYSKRFFVINCAVAGPPFMGGIATFHHYNQNGVSSSLAVVKDTSSTYANRTTYDPMKHYGPGEAAADFVPVISMERLIRAIPEDIEISLVKTDTQGFDLDVIKSASRGALRRVKKLITETYLKGIEERRYEGVKNDLVRDWMPYMEWAGYELENPTDQVENEYDAIWHIVDDNTHNGKKNVAGESPSTFLPVSTTNGPEQLIIQYNIVRLLYGRNIECRSDCTKFDDVEVWKHFVSA